MKTRLIVAIITSLLDEAVILAIIVLGLPRLGIKLPVWLTVLIAVLFLAWSVIIFRVGTRVLRKQPLSGMSDMVGIEGIVESSLRPEGIVKIEGELWKARSESGIIEAGQTVIVVAQYRLKLTVRLKAPDERSVPL